MRIAVTGASGFVGGAVARGLAARGHTVFGFGRRPAGALGFPLPHYAQWDLPANPVDVPSVDAVVHCAARVGDWGPESDYRRANVAGTQKVLDAFAACGRFVHVSSASVYSTERPETRLGEDAPVGVGLYSAYARSKFDAEKTVLASGRDAVILRPHIVYGPGDTTLMPRVLAARSLGWLPVPGNGRNRVSVTHVWNLVHAVERAVESPVQQGIFNIADGEEGSIDELLRTLLRRYGAPTRLLYIPRPIAWAAAVMGERVWRLTRRPRAPRLTRYVVAHLADGCTLDLSRARRQLGYAPRYTFRDGPLRVEAAT